MFAINAAKNTNTAIGNTDKIYESNAGNTLYKEPLKINCNVVVVKKTSIKLINIYIITANPFPANMVNLLMGLDNIFLIELFSNSEEYTSETNIKIVIGKMKITKTGRTASA